MSTSECFLSAPPRPCEDPASVIVVVIRSFSSLRFASLRFAALRSEVVCCHVACHSVSVLRPLLCSVPLSLPLGLSVLPCCRRRCCCLRVAAAAAAVGVLLLGHRCHVSLLCHHHDVEKVWPRPPSPLCGWVSVVGGCFVGVADDVAVPLSSPVSSSLPNTASQTAVGYCVFPSSRWVVCSACHALLACSWQTVCRSRNNKGTLGTTLQVACKPRGHVSLGGSCAAVGGGAYVRKWRRWRSQSSHKSRYTKPCPPPTTTTTTSRSSSISFHDEQNDVEPLCQHALQLR